MNYVASLYCLLHSLTLNVGPSLSFPYRAGAQPTLSLFLYQKQASVLLFSTLGNSLHSHCQTWMKAVILSFKCLTISLQH